MRIRLIALTATAAAFTAAGAEIVAHRGENTQAPENSLPAFRAAFANGANIIEGDFYLTEAGDIVCIHTQSEMKKLAGSDMPIVKLGRDDLQTLDLASKSFKSMSPVRIPTAEEVFAEIPKGKSIFFEIKNYPKGFFEKLESARKSAGLDESQISLISFDFNALKDAKSRNPRYKCYFLYNIKNRDGKILPEAGEIAGRVKSANLDGVDVSCWGLTEEYVRDLKSRGMHVAVWTVNKVEDMEKFIKWGVDSVTTDRSAEFIKALSGKK